MSSEVRQWEGLPSTALVSIFRKLGVEDRFKGGPLVCRTWNEASRNPLCWESMLPEGESPELHFIKRSGLRSYHPEWDFSFRGDNFDDGRGEVSPRHYACNLSFNGFRSFIDRSHGCATTIYLPFYCDVQHSRATLEFIAQRCPKLKHLSFKEIWVGAESHFLALLSSCKDLELLDLGEESVDWPSSQTTLQEVGWICPGLRGLRYSHGPDDGRDYGSIMAYSFPKLQFLNLEFTELTNSSLLTILKGCKQLRYLSVTRCGYNIVLDQSKIANFASSVISEFLFNGLYHCQNQYQEAAQCGRR